MTGRQILQKALETKNLEAALSEFYRYGVTNGSIPKKELRGLLELSDTGEIRSPDPLYTHSLVKMLQFCPSTEFGHMFNHIIRQMLDQNQPEDSLSLMRAVQLANTGKIDIEYKTLEKLMLTAKYLRDVEFAWSAVQTLKLRYTNLYSRTWGLFLSLVLDAGDYAALEYIWKEAAIPGYIILDDHSYTAMAQIAASHGNMEMCHWAVIGITERQKFHGRVLSNFVQLQVYLIEAATANVDPSKRQLSKAVQAACRYIVQMEDGAGRVNTLQLPNLIKLLDNTKALEYFEAMFQEMLEDPNAHEMVKLLFFNILLRRADPDTQLQLYHISQQHQIELNDESVLMLLDLGLHLVDLQFINQIVRGRQGKRVQERYRRAIQALS